MNAKLTNEAPAVTLYPNPLRATLPATRVVHCSYTGRPIRVERSDVHGQVWELIEPGHPSFGMIRERFVGMSYREFQPQCCRP